MLTGQGRLKVKTNWIESWLMKKKPGQAVRTLIIVNSVDIKIPNQRQRVFFILNWLIANGGSSIPMDIFFFLQDPMGQGQVLETARVRVPTG